MAAARKVSVKDNEENPFLNPAKEIIQNPLEAEVEVSFLSYAYSVINSRALPDARDGLKPVHRRILFSMFDNGQTADRQHVKSAKIAGNVIGTLHPHGDAAVYEAMVRLAQPFTMSIPLIDGHGNFGDQPGAAPASSRYTESRLAKEASLLLGELKEGTVETRPNYDGTIQEPVVLPVMFPNLLVNGTEGIAVGMATKMPPHNPSEVIDAARWLLTHPNASLEKLMEFIPGPDLPMGGLILGQDAIKEAYETGRGVFRIRGRYHIEQAGRGKSVIVFTEMPYATSSVTVIENVKKAIDDNKIQGISDIKDLTDRRNGTRLTIETKVGVNPEALLFDLFKHTSLETSFGINNVVLVNGEPNTVGLKGLLQIFLDHRVDVVTLRTTNRVEKRKTRLHLVEGLLKALADIDKVIAIVRKSPDADTAKTTLIKTFKVDDVQADYILSLQLRRLTKFDQVELNNEKKTLSDELKELQKILDDPAVLKALIGKELETVRKQLDRDRKTTIVDGDLAVHLEATKAAAASSSLEVADAPCAITLFASGSLSRTEDVVPVSLRGKVDPIVGVVSATTRGHFVAVTNFGRGFRVEALHVGDAGKTTAKQLDVSLKTGERFVAVGKNAVPEGEAGLALGTRAGMVKVSTADYPLRADEFPVMALGEGDEILGGGWVSDAAQTDFVFISSDTSLLRFEGVKVRPQGSKGAGMAGIKLASDQEAVSFSVVSGNQREGAEVITYTGSSVKRSRLSDAPVKGRATGGVRFHGLKKTWGETQVVRGFVGVSPLIVDSAGKSIDLPSLAKRDASGTATVETVAVIGTRS